LQRLFPRQSPVRLKPRHTNAQRRLDTDHHVETATLAGLNEERDVVYHHPNSVVACLAVGSVSRRVDVWVNDLVQPVPGLVVCKHDGCEGSTIELTAGNNAVAELADDIRQGPRARFNNTPCEHIVVNDSGAQLAKTSRRGRLPSADAASEPNP